jgi:TldD protein
MNSINTYLDTFKVTIPQMESLVGTALSHGGDFADLYFEHTTFFNLLLKDGVVSSGGFHTDYGVGIRVLKGEKTGYAYSESTEMQDMVKAAEAASAIALGCDASLRFAAVADRKLDMYPMTRNWRDDGADAFLPFIKELEKSIFEKDSRIV